MNKIHIVLLGILIVIILGVIMLISSTEDKEGPEILFRYHKLTFTEGSDTDELLYGVIAIDSKDGDMSDTLLIESILPSFDDTTAKVTYAARDKENNITKKNLIVNYISMNSIKSDEPKSGDKLSEASETIPTQAPTVSVLDEVTTNAGSEGTIPIEDNVDETSGEVTAAKTEEAVPEWIPVIKLNRKEISLKKGTKFDFLDYVESITDDKDDTYTIYNRIKIEGFYTMKSVGTYIIEYYVTDSYWNQSEPAYLKLIVTE